MNVRVTGYFSHGDVNCGDGVEGRIVHNGVAVWIQVDNSPVITSFPFSLDISLLTGDTLDFEGWPRVC